MLRDCRLATHTINTIHGDYLLKYVFFARIRILSALLMATMVTFCAGSNCSGCLALPVFVFASRRRIGSEFCGGVFGELVLFEV